MKLQEIESEVRKLTPKELAELRELIEDLIEDELELSDEFKAKIEQGRRDIAEGRTRVRQTPPRA